MRSEGKGTRGIGSGLEEQDAFNQRIGSLSEESEARSKDEYL